MIKINWEAFKEYKQTRYIPQHSRDNFHTLIDFLRNYYNITTVVEIFDTIQDDEVGRLMLSKRDLDELEKFESYFHKEIQF